MSKSHKLKANKGLLKRVTITARGKVKFKRSGTSHLNSSFSGQRTRDHRRRRMLKAGDIRRAERMLHMRLIPGDRPRPQVEATAASQAAGAEAVA